MRSSLITLFIILFSFSSINCIPKPIPRKVVLNIWHWMTDRHATFEELAKKYEEKTGIRVNFELYAPSDAYAQKVRAAAQGKTLPDIFGILGEKKDFAAFVKGGYILDLTPYMKEDNSSWENRFFKEALVLNEFSITNAYGVKPGIYAVPIDIMTIQFVYNKELCKKLGINPEESVIRFQDLLDIGKKIKEQNLKIYGLVSGWAEIWLINCLVYNYAFNIMGEEKVFATIRGDLPYTNSDWVKVLNIFKEMRDAGVLAPGIITMVNKTAEQIFATEKAVFAFNGSWCVNVYKGMNPNLKYGVMLPPLVSDNYPIRIWGGAGSSFVVNAYSKNKQEAISFLKWLTDDEQQTYLLEKTNNLPANKNCLKELPPILIDFVKGMNYAMHPHAWDIAESPIVNETLGLGVQSIIIGKKTPEEVLAQVQKIKEKEMLKQRQ